MKRKYLLFSSILSLSITTGLTQDTTKVLSNKNLKSNITFENSNTYLKPHTVINSRGGTTVSNTTSGTLGSNVNPSTEFVIPFTKPKRKENSNVNDSGLVSPVKK